MNIIASPGSAQSYRVQLYNDSGLVKTIPFSFSQSSVSISLSGLLSGNYYINVLDEQGNVVNRKLIPAY